ncbi:MAG TPA: hypothetical protein VFS67_14415 [Polyangiaceae bacterium]|nr:hypothetical protein [Polyangiaceae bacterium]
MPSHQVNRAPDDVRSHRLPDQGIDDCPVAGLELSLLDPVAELTKLVQDDLERLQRRANFSRRASGSLACELLLQLRNPLVNPSRCHGALIADLRPDGKRKKRWSDMDHLRAA